MQTITYPDGELVRYTYDAGGQLNGVSGKKAGTEYRYVDSILYDEQGQRVYIRYGNGVETRYKYDPARRWLDSIKTVNKDKNLIFQNIKYNFDAVGNVAGYENTASTYATSQSYTYDNLYQLVKADGTTKSYAGVNPVPENPGSVLCTNKYRQTFGFDDIGNMMSKVSTTKLPGGGSGGKNDAALNYNLDYEYDPSYAHRLIRAGERYYKYDANGNLIAEKDGAFADDDEISFTYSYFEDLDVYGVDYGFDLAPSEKDPANLADTGTQAGKKNGYRRDYEWNERNLLSRSRDSEKTVTYRYGDDGERALKFCRQTNSETLYFNNFYSMQQVAHEPNHEQGLRVSKHIFVGNSRLVTALTHQAGVDTTEQAAKLYYYHADHLQSAQFITDANGEKYEHIEYTPYGELWIEETASGVDKLPFRFTGKELDEETGLYYYGARYLDPKYSRWLSGDPAIGEYIPQAPINDQAKKHNENLPGMGGVFNTVNLHVYHYAGNNPVKYTDPDGRRTYVVNGINNENKVGSPGTIEKFANMLEAVGVQDVRTFGIYNTRGNWYDGFVDIMNVVKEMFNADVYSDALVETIVNDLKENPLQDGEQLNLIGYSGGGQVIANATEKLNKNGVKVSNMVFIGAPIQEIFDTNSKVLNLIGAFDVLSSIVFGKNTQNKFSGWHGHCGYFDDKNIDNTVEIIFNEIN